MRGDLKRSDKVRILEQLAADYIDLDEVTTAEDALRELIAYESDHHWGYSALMKLQQRQGKWDDAFDTAVKLLKLESNKSKKPLGRIKFLKGQDLFKKREYHKARVVFREAVGFDPRPGWRGCRRQGRCSRPQTAAR